MRTVLLYAFEMLFIVCVVYAMITDYRRLRIPNIACLVLAAGFFPFAMLAGPAVPLLPHLLVAVAVFLVLFATFAMSWLGAGDVKLAGAIMLWVGPAQGANFVVLFALLGGVFALMLLSLRHLLLRWPQIESLAPLAKLSQWARLRIFPYGLPIGIAALCVAPAVFARVS